MQGSEQLRKWSDLQGLAAVTIAGGKKVGTLDDFYFNPQNNTIYALKIKTGMFGHRALLASVIRSVGQDAITFADESQLVEEKSDNQLQVLPLGRSLLSYKIMSEGGTAIGNIGNLELDVSNPTMMRITTFELTGGLRNRLSGHYPTFSSGHVIRYGQDVVVIPDAVALPLTQR